MNALRVMWKDTRMVVLTALSAALYAAILIPFTMFTIIPGVTGLRPANAIPIVCGILFGPAGAWGSAFGNLIGDFFFGLGPGSLFGMVGNFLYGFIPYAFWRAMFGNAEPDPRKTSHWVGLLFICVVASAACAFTIAWGIEAVIEGVPFAILGTIIFFNNLLMAVVLSPPLLFALLPRVKKWGLLYTAILPADDVKRPRFAWLGLALLTVGSIAGLVGGTGAGRIVYKQPQGIPYIIKALASKPVQDEKVKLPGRALEKTQLGGKRAGSQGVGASVVTGLPRRTGKKTSNVKEGDAAVPSSVFLSGMTIRVGPLAKGILLCLLLLLVLLDTKTRSNTWVWLAVIQAGTLFMLGDVSFILGPRGVFGLSLLPMLALVFLGMLLL